MSSLPADAATHLTDWLGPDWSAAPLAGDASVRAYYRVTAPDGQTYILTYYPEEVRPQLARFLGAYEAVAPYGPVPRVLHHSAVSALQEDVGNVTLFDVLHVDRGEGLRLYRAAIELLVMFQRAECSINPPFTAPFFEAELEMTLDFYVEQLMGRPRGPLAAMMKTLAQNVAQHPSVICHRDYHGQNLHVTNGDLFLIDYQDLRMGPDTYDLASLLRDRGVGLIIGDEAELDLIEHYRGLRGADAGIRHRYFETLLQRSIKILGTFSKQPIARGRLHYLDFIPATLASIERCLAELPEYGELRETFPMQFDLDAARKRAQELKAE